MKRIAVFLVAGALLAACGSDGSETVDDTTTTEALLKGRGTPVAPGSPVNAAPLGSSGVVAAPALPPIRTGRATTNDPASANSPSDFVIFAFGDSYGSGEGNPYKPGNYNLVQGLVQAFPQLAAEIRKDINDLLSTSKIDPSRPRALPAILTKETWSGSPGPGISPSGDERCHRSDASGSAKAAAKVKSQNPALNVIHKSFACSGAETKHILSERYQGADEVLYKGQPLLPSQIDQAINSGIAPSEVDAIYVSIGGNDAGFGDVVKECFVWHQSSCQNADRTLVRGAIGRLDTVASNIENVARTLRDRFKNAHIFFSAYPDPLSVSPNDPGDVNKDGICSRVDGVLGVRFYNDYLWKISTPDAVFIRESFLAPLNANIQRGVKKSGSDKVWFVDGHYANNSGFAGFCSKTNIPITRFVHEALILQGEDCDVMCGPIWVSKGGWHPSDAGYTAYGDAIYSSMVKSGILSKSNAAPASPSNPWPTALSSSGSISIAWDDLANNETSYEVIYGWTNSGAPKTQTLPADSTSFTFNTASAGLAAIAVRACKAGPAGTAAMCSAYSSLNVSNALPAEPPGAVTCTTSTYGQVPQGGCSVTFSIPTTNYYPASMFSYVEVKKGTTIVGAALMPPGGGQVFLKHQGEAVGSTAQLVATAYLCSIVDGGKCVKGPDSTLNLTVVKSDGRGVLPVIKPNLRPSAGAPALPGVAPAPVLPPSIGGSLQCNAGKCGP